MKIHSKTAAPMAVGNGGGNSNAVAAQNYHLTRKTATGTELAATIVAARFRLSPCVARLVCELAHIGGRFA